MQLAVPRWPKSSYLACCLLCRKARSGVAAHSGMSQRGHGPLLCSKLAIGARRESWARMSPMQPQHIPTHSACHAVCQRWGIPDKITVPKTQELEVGIRLKFKHYQKISKIKRKNAKCLWIYVQRWGSGKNHKCPFLTDSLRRDVHRIFNITNKAPPNPPRTPVMKNANISHEIHS